MTPAAARRATATLPRMALTDAGGSARARCFGHVSWAGFKFHTALRSYIRGPCGRGCGSPWPWRQMPNSRMHSSTEQSARRCTWGFKTRTSCQQNEFVSRGSEARPLHPSGKLWVVVSAVCVIKSEKFDDDPRQGQRMVLVLHWWHCQTCSLLHSCSCSVEPGSGLRIQWLAASFFYFFAAVFGCWRIWGGTLSLHPWTHALSQPGTAGGAPGGASGGAEDAPLVEGHSGGAPGCAEDARRRIHPSRTSAGAARRRFSANSRRKEKTFRSSARELLEGGDI